MPWLSELKRALQKLGEPEVPRSDRWPVSGIAAFYGLESPSTPAPIKDIGPGGIFLAVQEPLPVGQLIPLKLQKEGIPELSEELQITIQARVARIEDSGAGLSFVTPAGVNEALWEVLIRDIVVLSDPDQIVEAFRTLRIVHFLCQLCQSGAEEAIALLGGHLDQNRTKVLFDIAQIAENTLAADPAAERMRAHPKLIANLLRDGSWTSDDLTTKFWAGLFVSSCTLEEPDDSNQVFIDILVQITPTEARIINHACQRALSPAQEPGDSTSVSVVLIPAEMARVTGVFDPTRNATDLAYLFNLGLIENVFDFTSYRQLDTFDITPSELGVEFYRHCTGQRGPIDPQLAASAREHLAVFFPPPIPSAFENFRPMEPDPTEEK